MGLLGKISLRLLPLLILSMSVSAWAQDINEIKKQAAAGDAKAQYNLGWLYYKGDGVPKDYAEAEAWFRRAANQGNADAQYNLGVMYNQGFGVPQDYAKSAAWYRKAAEQGNV